MSRPNGLDENPFIAWVLGPFMRQNLYIRALVQRICTGHGRLVACLVSLTGNGNHSQAEGQKEAPTA